MQARMTPWRSFGPTGKIARIDEAADGDGLAMIEQWVEEEVRP